MKLVRVDGIYEQAQESTVNDAVRGTTLGGVTAASTVNKFCLQDLKKCGEVNNNSYLATAYKDGYS
jgi:hypothetical protein